MWDSDTDIIPSKSESDEMDILNSSSVIGDGTATSECLQSIQTDDTNRNEAKQPDIVIFAFKNYKIRGCKSSGTCKICDQHIHETKGVTTGFIRYFINAQLPKVEFVD